MVDKTQFLLWLRRFDFAVIMESLERIRQTNAY
jgi:hypothetical protein